MEHLFNTRLKELRKNKGLSQMALAGIFYTTQQTISAWEKRLKESDFGMLIAIAKFFEVSIEYLLGLED